MSSIPRYTHIPGYVTPKKNGDLCFYKDVEELYNIIDALLGFTSSIQTKVNGLLLHYRYSDFLDKRIYECVEHVARCRSQALEITKGVPIGHEKP